MRHLLLPVPLAIGLTLGVMGPAAASPPGSMGPAPNPQWPNLPAPPMSSCGIGATFALGAVFDVTGTLEQPGATDFALVGPQELGCTGG